MKLAIFGYPRAGTTMLTDIVAQHLVAAGEMSPYHLLGEVFNPVDGRKLTVKEIDGELRLVHDVHAPDQYMSREKRFMMFSRRTYQHPEEDYIIKVMSHDTSHDPLLPWLVEHYPIVTIERRNHLEAYLSWAIAWHTKNWNTKRKNPKPHYEPFEADIGAMKSASHIFARYFHAKPKIPARAHVYYEDMCEMSSEDLLRHIGCYRPGVPTPATKWTKLHGLDEKVRIITNLDEVIELYNSTVATIAFLGG